MVQQRNCKAIPMPTQQTILDKSIPEPNSGCWLWLGAGDNYGILSEDNANWLAHRIAYTLFKGSIPKGLLVRHLCHNKFCVNPDHLAVGTDKDNRRDDLNKKRQLNPLYKWWKL